MSWLLFLFAPIGGGLLYGFERVLRARMQRRMGPPLLQPFYDMFKLLEKRTLIIHAPHALLSVIHFIVLWISLGVIVFGGSLLYAIFLHLFAQILLIIAGYSVQSPYSHLGANRELLSIIAYEPVLILIAVAFYLHSGSFEVATILRGEDYVIGMPLLLAALLIILPLKTKKSPFDATEAHQEIVGGIEIEYSGLFYEFLYMSRFLEYVFIYSFVFLFGGKSLWLGVILAAGAFLAVNLIDNATARVRIADALFIIYASAFVMAVINIAGLLV